MTILTLLLAILLPGPQSDTFTIKSEILGQTRTVFVHVPKSFAKTGAKRRYPTIVVFDGKYVMDPVVTMSDILTRDGQMPEAVVVAIDNIDDFEGRVHDLTPPGMSVSGSGLNEGGDKFLDFIEKELLPAIDAKFRTSEPRVLVGLSSGGILTTYAAATRDTFRLTLSLDGPTQFGDRLLGKKLVQRARTKPSPPIRYVSYFARFSWPQDEWKSIVAAAPESWMLHNEQLEQESHNSMRFLGSYLGLRELFRDYSMFKAPTITTSILPSYDKLTASYGAPLVPPERLLHDVVDDFLIEGRGAAARRAFDTLTTAYGEQPEAAKTREEIARVERQPPPTETVESLLAMPFPTASQLGDYLGVWQGHMWMNPAAKTRVELRLVADGEKVTGSWVSWPEPDVEDVQPLQYLQLTKEGLAFGMMNGTHPRGVLIHDGKREGETMHGKVNFGGIAFKPHGEVYFELHHRP